ncbi:MAG: YkgJ family cysteine cluster protein [Chitinophagaceae bacterium]
MPAPLNLKSFAQKQRHNKAKFNAYLESLLDAQPEQLDATVAAEAPKVWEVTDCLSCANCCKKMSPTFTSADIKRIASHLKMTPKAFKEKYLYQPPNDTDWMNRSQPCQFLNLNDNKCSIYEVRPADCAGFPHFDKFPTVDYMHVHQQNVAYCPATYNLVERLMDAIPEPNV